MMKGLKPCPFCGKKDLRLDLTWDGTSVLAEANKAVVTCPRCGVKMTAFPRPGYYEPVGNGMYKEVPMKYAEEMLLENWNRRTNPCKHGEMTQTKICMETGVTTNEID